MIQGLAGVLLLASGVLAGNAQAAGPEVWAALHDARLAEAADRDPGAAIAIYETVLHHLPDDDVLRGDLLLQLARARFDEGDLAGARAALVDASHDPQVSAQARAWRVQVDAFQHRIQALPLSTTFADGTAPFVLGWSAAASASLSGGPPGLVWTTVVRDNRDDYVLAALDARAAPLHILALRIESSALDAHLRVIVEDDGGRRWTAPVVALDAGAPTDLELEVLDLLPAQAAGPLVADPDAIRVVMLQDVTAFHTAQRGINQLTVSRFELR